jgi:hypothetical protein
MRLIGEAGNGDAIVEGVAAAYTSVYSGVKVIVRWIRYRVGYVTSNNIM